MFGFSVCVRSPAWYFLHQGNNRLPHKPSKTVHLHFLVILSPVLVHLEAMDRYTESNMVFFILFDWFFHDVRVTAILLRRIPFDIHNRVRNTKRQFLVGFLRSSRPQSFTCNLAFTRHHLYLLCRRWATKPRKRSNPYFCFSKLDFKTNVLTLLQYDITIIRFSYYLLHHHHLSSLVWIAVPFRFWDPQMGVL